MMFFQFFHKAKGGGPEFFAVGKGGTRILTYAKGGPEKIGDPRSQTDAPTPAKK